MVVLLTAHASLQFQCMVTCGLLCHFPGHQQQGVLLYCCYEAHELVSDPVPIGSSIYELYVKSYGQHVIALFRIFRDYRSLSFYSRK